jgi:hypothetical protein
MQITYFHDLTGRVALQNRDNKEVPRRIVQDKELRDALVYFGRFWMKNDQDNWRKSLELIMRRSREIICKGRMKNQKKTAG